MRDRNIVNLEGRGGREEVGGVERGETIHGINWMRKEPIFNLKKRQGFKIVYKKYFS